MAKQTRNQLKAWFKKGKYPTEAQFADGFDSYVHKDDKVDMGTIDGLTDALNNKAAVSVEDEVTELKTGQTNLCTDLGTTQDEVSAIQDTLPLKADLMDGKVPSKQLPDGVVNGVTTYIADSQDASQFHISDSDNPVPTGDDGLPVVGFRFQLLIDCPGGMKTPIRLYFTSLTDKPEAVINYTGLYALSKPSGASCVGTNGDILDCMITTPQNGKYVIKILNILGTQELGEPNGIATLDGDGKVAGEQLPTMVKTVNSISPDNGNVNVPLSTLVPLEVMTVSDAGQTALILGIRYSSIKYIMDASPYNEALDRSCVNVTLLFPVIYPGGDIGWDDLTSMYTLIVKDEFIEDGNIIKEFPVSIVKQLTIVFRNGTDYVTDYQNSMIRAGKLSGALLNAQILLSESVIIGNLIFNLGYVPEPEAEVPVPVYNPPKTPYYFVANWAGSCTLQELDSSFPIPSNPIPTVERVAELVGFSFYIINNPNGSVEDIISSLQFPSSNYAEIPVSYGYPNPNINSGAIPFYRNRTGKIEIIYSIYLRQVVAVFTVVSEQPA